MKDEIKAILIQNGEPTPENPIEIKRLLVNKEAEDYITNLQEEKEEFRLLKERYQLIKEIYKQRIDKAIEYLNEPNRDEFDYSITYLLEILQGGDE